MWRVPKCLKSSQARLKRISSRFSEQVQENYGVRLLYLDYFDKKAAM